MKNFQNWKRKRNFRKECSSKFFRSGKKANKFFAVGNY